jgi:hypothetical protein
MTPITRTRFRSRYPTASFAPGLLFLGGEQGAWYDPSDLSTLFQDAAGTTPVTAAGQAVRLMLDKSKGLMLGPELLADPNFDNAGSWEKNAGVTISGGLAVWNTAGTSVYVRQPSIIVANTYYEFTIVCSSYTSGSLFVALGAGGSTVSSYPINSVGTVRYRYNSGSFSGRVWLLTPVGGAQLSITSFSVKQVTGNHAMAPSDAARPVLQADAGGLLHLLSNGSSQSMSTNSIDFTATDKMTVFAGVRKLSDAGRGIVAELSTSTAANNGSFRLAAPEDATFEYGMTSRGTSDIGANIDSATYAAPITNVLTGIGNIAAPEVTLRVNATQVATNAASQGTGNYGNYPLFIGARNNSSQYFNGRLYGLIVRGAQSSAAQITATELWMAGKTGVAI